MQRLSFRILAVVLFSVLALSACGGNSATSNTNGSGAAPAAGGATTVNVGEKDYILTLDKTSVPAGPVTFKMVNMGPSTHNVAVIAGDGASKDKGVTGATLKEGAVINMGQNESVTLDLKPGTYQVYCSVAGHVQLGMIMPLTVT